MALLFAAPAWLIFDGIRPNAAFAALAASTSMAPDLDLVAMKHLFVEHHGVTHSVVFAVPAALVLGAVVAGAYVAVRDDVGASPKSVYAFATAALFAGLVSHMFADVLTSPDIAPPIKPFYPVSETTVALDSAYVKSHLWNLGTLALGIAVQAGFAAEERFA